MPSEWWGDTEKARALIESEGPWPSPTPISNGVFVPLDVDRYAGLAMVVAFGENAGLKFEGVNAATFQRTGPGDYRRRNGGGGAGYTMNDRWEIGADEKAVVKLRVHSGRGSEPSDALFLCGPEVVTIEVERREETRIADVREGPGWFGVIWPSGDPPRVSAFDGNGDQTCLWTPPI